MRKAIIIFVSSLFASVGTFFFVKNNFSSHELRESSLMFIKGEGPELFNGFLSFEKGTKAIDIVKRLEKKWIKPKTILIKVKNKWTIVSQNKKIYNDTIIKIKI